MDSMERVGRWLLPAPGLGVDPTRVQRRAGAIGLAIFVAAMGVALGAVLRLVLHPTSIAQVTGPGVALMIVIAMALVLAMVFLPPAVFRTRSRAQTERLLASPTSRLRSWSRTTMAIDLLAAAVMVGAVYFTPEFTLAVLAVALLVRAAVRGRRQRAHDPDARYLAVMGAGTSLAVVGAIIAIVSPLSAQVLAVRGPLPFVLAAGAVVLVEIGFGALDRWVRMDDSPWVFVRDLLDPRRWVIALVLACTAWIAVAVAETITSLPIDASADLGSAACLLVLVLAWVLIWAVALMVWRIEGRRILRRWAVHQGQVLVALQSGALDPQVAARAAAAATARMAVTVFGADAVVMCRPDGTRTTTGVDDCRVVDAVDLVRLPHRRIRVAASPLDEACVELLVIQANAPGRVALRSNDLRTQFISLSLATLLAPRLAAAPALTPSMSLPAVPDVILEEQGEAARPAVPGSLRADLTEATALGQVEAVATAIMDLHQPLERGLLVGLSWSYRIGGEDLRHPATFLSVVQESIPVASVAAELLCDAAVEAAALVDVPVVVPMPACLLAPEAGVHALPNIVAGIDRTTAMRTVLAFTALPAGSGQALRVLDDLGFRLAVTDACASADPSDLQGWRRWAVMVDLDADPDPLHVQQVMSAIATSDTAAVGMARGPVEPAHLAACDLSWLVDLRRPTLVGAP